MDKKPAIFSKDTLVPIGMLVAIAGGIFWLALLYSDSKYTKEQLRGVDDRVRNMETRQSSLERFQSTTEQRLENIEKLLTEVRDTIKILTAQPISKTR